MHKTTIGGNPMTHVKAEMDVTRDEKSLKYVRWMINSVPPPTYTKAVDFGGSNVDRWQEFAFSAPSNILQWSGAVKTGTGAREHGNREGGFSLRIFHGLTPETDNTCFYFFTPANGYKQGDPKATEVLYDQIAEAFMEDKIFCEGQQARIDERGEAHLVDIVSDATRIQLRRIIKKMFDEEQKLPAAVSAPTARIEIPITAAK
ncbi:MAG: hypothetical protein EOP39_24950 [Rubrivivax sp.]|nr:MAG: hypothetical protein EOP39_24950 [Rubrivivax sp.]